MSFTCHSLAAAELQYASFIYPLSGDPLSDQYTFNLKQVNFVFRISTSVTLVLVTIWIAILLIPSTSVKLGLGRFERWVKEFCWGLFGNLFVLEIMIFIYFAFSKESISSALAARYGTLMAVLLTFPATWNYAKGDQQNTEMTPRKRFGWVPIVVEHAVVYTISYLIFLLILWYMGTMPIP